MIGFTNTERKKFRKELADYLNSDGLFNILLNGMEFSRESSWRRGNTHYEYEYNNAVDLRELIFSKVTLKPEMIEGRVGVSTANIPEKDKSLLTKGNIYVSMHITITYNGRRYTISSWRNNLRMVQETTEYEKEERMKKVQTDYAIIQRNGKKALVKFLDGDRKALKRGSFIKKKTHENLTDDSVTLLFNLDPDMEK